MPAGFTSIAYLTAVGRWPQLVLQHAVNANLRAETGSKPWPPS